MLIAAALVLAIRTARWAAKDSDPRFSDVDQPLDREIAFAIRMTDRLLHALVKSRPSLFPQREVPVYAPEEGDSPQ